LKLLPDQNLPRRLAESLKSHFAEVRHISRIGMQSASDEEIWLFARDNGFAILSKDADFHHFELPLQAPPKTIWLELGNTSTNELRECLVGNLDLVSDFLGDDSSALW
jgi:predicted nuclease of predicted toxin-antitoxin system